MELTLNAQVWYILDSTCTVETQEPVITLTRVESARMRLRY